MVWFVVGGIALAVATLSAAVLLALELRRPILMQSDGALYAYGVTVAIGLIVVVTWALVTWR